MYESFFRLKAPPFPATPTVQNYYPSQSAEQARQTAIRAVERGEGPVLAVGPAGIGKTLLCRLLAAHFEHLFQVVLLTSAQICTRKALLQNILFELRLPYRDMDEGELHLSLVEHLQPSESCPHGMLLILDEAHTLPARLLEEIRMLTNVLGAGDPRVRLVMAGGPRLDERFSSPKLEAFNQRIAARCYLQPLRREETADYIRARLAFAGGAAHEIFSEDALAAVYQATDGIPRLVNQVCDHALTLACTAGRRWLDTAAIQEAWADLQQLPSPWHETRVEAAPGSAIIEFGTLDGDDLRAEEAGNAPALHDEPAESAYGDPSPVPRVTQTAGAAASAVSAELAGPGAQIEAEMCDAQALEAAAREADDPFDTEFEQEEVIFDPFAEPVPRGPLFHGSSHGPPQETAAHGVDRPATLEDRPVPAGAMSPPADALMDECQRAADVQAVLQEAESLLAESDGFDAEEPLPLPARHEAQPDKIHEAAARPHSPDVFEYTVFEPATDADMLLETSAVLPAPATRWEYGTAEAEALLAGTVPLRPLVPPDDRDLIEIQEASESAGAASEPAPAPEAARRMEYQELFAQLRRLQ